MNILLSGCSFSAGTGLTKPFVNEFGVPQYNECKDSKDLWINQLHRKYYPDSKLDNISRGGNSNLRIFQMATTALLSKNYKVAFIQWTSFMRHEWSIGFETWNTTFRSTLGSKTGRSINLHNNVSYDNKLIQNKFDKFFILEHQHYRIVQIIEYMNILCKIARLTGTELYFINGLCWWDQDYFIKINYTLPSDTTEFTQELLDLPNHSDDEFAELYNKMHNEYIFAGGIHEDKWLNLYNSMYDNRIDRGTDGNHPGTSSNAQYTLNFIQALDSKTKLYYN